MPSPEVKSTAPISRTPGWRSMTRRDFLRLTFGAVAVVGTGAFLEGCRYFEDQTVTTEIGDVDGQQLPEVFSSKKRLQKDQQDEVSEKLTELVNSAGRNVARVKTTYSFGYLKTAEVSFAPGQGKGNSLRVELIQSQELRDKAKQADIEKKLAESEKRVPNPLQINRIYSFESLAAAEVWSLNP